MLGLQDRCSHPLPTYPSLSSHSILRIISRFFQTLHKHAVFPLADSLRLLLTDGSISSCSNGSLGRFFKVVSNQRLPKSQWDASNFFAIVITYKAFHVAFATPVGMIIIFFSSWFCSFDEGINSKNFVEYEDVLGIKVTKEVSIDDGLYNFHLVSWTSSNLAHNLIR